MFKICLENHIVRRLHHYKCCLCNYDGIRNDFNAVQEHLWDFRHQMLLVDPNRINGCAELHSLTLISENQRRIIVENEITIGFEQSYRCHLCSWNLASLVDVFEHLKSVLHQEKFKIQYKRILKSRKHKSSFDEAEKIAEDHKSSLDQAKKIANKNKSTLDQPEKIAKEDESTLSASEKVAINEDKFFEKQSFCTDCQVPLTNSAVIKSHCMMHLFQQYNLTQTDVIQFHGKETQQYNAECLACQKTMTSDESLIEHLKTSTHETIIEYFLLLKAKKEKSTEMILKNIPEILSIITSCIVCNICNVNVLDQQGIANHAKSQEHHTNILKLDAENLGNVASKTNLEDNGKSIEKSNCIDDDFNFICFICNQTFEAVTDLFQHYTNNATHRLRLSHLQDLSNILNKPKSVESPEYIDLSVPEFIDLSIPECIDLSLPEISKKQSTTGNQNIYSKSKQFKKKKRKSKSKKKKKYEYVNEKKTKQKKKQECKYVEKSSNEKKSSNKNICSLVQNYIQRCIEKGSKNMYNIQKEVTHQLEAAAKFLCSYQSKLFCLLCKCTVESMDVYVYEHIRSIKHRNNILCDKDSRNVQNKLIELAQDYLNVESDYYVHCFACDARLPNFYEQINTHIMLEYHENRILSLKDKGRKLNAQLKFIHENYWYYAQFFLCIVCDARFVAELAFIIHFQSEKHKNACQKLNLEECSMKFDVCPLCVTCWYGPSTAYNEHCTTYFHEYFLTEYEFVIPDLLPIAKELLNRTEEVIKTLVNDSDRTLLDRKNEHFLLKDLEKIIKKIQPYATIYIFGSRFSYTALSDSDINICCDCKNLSSNDEEYGAKELLKVRYLIENEHENWIVSETSISPVPFMKLSHIDTNLKCDIAFSNNLVVEKSKLIRNYVGAFPMCRRMILYLKKWLLYCQLSGPNCITSYTLSWLVIFYLQVQGILPGAHTLLKSKRQPVIIDGWECGFTELNPISSSTLSFKELLRGFFLYYSIFDYHSCIICPFLGEALTKSSFADIDKLPNKLHIYKQQIDQRNIEYLRLDFPMCIQDSINHSQNLTKTVTKFQLRCFKEYCHRSAAILISTCVLNA